MQYKYCIIIFKYFGFKYYRYISLSNAYKTQNLRNHIFRNKFNKFNNENGPHVFMKCKSRKKLITLFLVYFHDVITILPYHFTHTIFTFFY